MARYSYAWRRSRRKDLEAAGYECERCHVGDRPDGPTARHSTLERAHLDGDRANGAPSNVAVLCRTCHRAHDYRDWATKTRERRLDLKDAARPLLVLVQLLKESA